jgi:IclR family acetate operon transcriptional repressor
MPARTDVTVTDPDELLAQLPAIADQGYAVDDGEQEAGVRCIAVPVLGGPGQTALSVSGPEGRLPAESVPQFAELLRATAAELAAELREDRGARVSDRAR